ncbi:peptidoglycan-binding protein [Streptomyces sp. NPDC005925]|uniref:peptidoglycan-binding domain-containing protein n=1 Tax=Streptomyces sp. NPDC005925 TaxID=3157172 RepID=UPI0033C3BDCF
MAEPKRHPCPECGTPREPDNTPACTCARRAADALRDTRTAQAAAAEDFDPLRIRPYVELDSAPTSRPAPVAPPGGLPATGGHLPPAGAARKPGASSVTSPPLAPPAGPPGDTGPRLCEATPTTRAHPDGDAGEGGDDPRPRRRRRVLLLAAAGSVVAVATAAGYASGMFSYDPPTRNSALPPELRASVPDAPADAATAGTGGATPSPGPASPGPSGDTSTSPSPGPTAPSASPAPAERSARPSTAPPATAPGTGAPPSGPAGGPNDATATGIVLRRGDRGAEVTELQLRLGQLYLYSGRADGRFSDRVEYGLRAFQWSRGVGTDADELGVYGPDTRRSLEAETREP